MLIKQRSMDDIDLVTSQIRGESIEKSDSKEDNNWFQALIGRVNERLEQRESQASMSLIETSFLSELGSDDSFLNLLPNSPIS